MKFNRYFLTLLSLSLMCLFTVTTASAETCPLPPGPGVAICLPLPDSTVTSPVEVSAAAGAHVGHHITAMRIYIDSHAVYTADSDPIDTHLNVAVGAHLLAVVAYDEVGTSYKSSEHFTVSAVTGPCLPGGAGAKICSPPPNATVSSPVMVSAGARPSSGRITAIRLYIDNVAVFTSDNTTQQNYYSINTSLNLSAGNHHLVEVAYQSTGGTQQASEFITVTAGTAPLYAYFAERSPNNMVAGFKINTDGSATQVPGSPYAIPSGGFVADPVKDLLFGSNGNAVDTYTINSSDGSLSVSDTLSGNYEHLEIDPLGQTVYATQSNQGGTDTNYIAYLNVAGNGSLTQTGFFDEGVSQFDLFFLNDTITYQPFCYHLDGEINGYTRAGNGTLTSFQTNAVLPNDGPDSTACPSSIAITPDGRYVAAPVNGEFNPNYHSIAVFSVNGDHTLSQVAGSPFQLSATSDSSAFDPTGHFLAVATTNGVQMYSFNGGTLTLIGGQGGGDISQVKWSPSGQLLFATSEPLQKVFIFNVNNGMLAMAPGSPHTLNFPPYWIALHQH